MYLLLQGPEQDLARECILARFLHDLQKVAKFRARLEILASFAKTTCKIICILQDEVYQNFAISCKFFSWAGSPSPNEVLYSYMYHHVCHPHHP